MNMLNQPGNPASSSRAIQPRAHTNRKLWINSYAALLQEPLKTLACNVADRSEISAIAILGYN
jgi:hypothetical protein